VPLGLDLTEANVTRLHAEGARTLVLAGLERGTSWEACYTPADLVRTLARQAALAECSRGGKTANGRHGMDGFVAVLKPNNGSRIARE